MEMGKKHGQARKSSPGAKLPASSPAPARTCTFLHHTHHAHQQETRLQTKKRGAQTGIGKRNKSARSRPAAQPQP